MAQPQELSDELVASLRARIDTLQHERDILLRRNGALVVSMTCCARRNELGEDCRVWLVMNDMLKTKRRVRRDGR